MSRRFTLPNRLLLSASLLLPPLVARAQAGDSTHTTESRRHYYTVLGAGFVSSILFHEAGHVGTAVALGYRPHFGLDKMRPTVYSGIDAVAHPRDQFLFSAAGLTAQNLLDELILDVPHTRGGTFERGLLAGGLATTAFYLTIGRNGSVSDVEYMQRTSNLNKADITLIFGSVALLDAWRIHRDAHYAHFFVGPASDGTKRLQVGVNLR